MGLIYYSVVFIQPNKYFTLQISLILVGIGVAPGYAIIKIYQNFVNRKLEDTYWKDFDARQKNG